MWMAWMCDAIAQEIQRRPDLYLARRRCSHCPVNHGCRIASRRGDVSVYHSAALARQGRCARNFRAKILCAYTA